VLTTVTGQLLVQRLGTRFLDMGRSCASISAGVAYISAKGIVSKLVAFVLLFTSTTTTVSSTSMPPTHWCGSASRASVRVLFSRP